MKRIISLIMAVALIVALSGCATKQTENTTKKEKLTLVLDWTPNTNHTGFYVAKKLGYYAEQGIDLEIVQPPEDGQYAMVASGKAQFCIGFQETLAAALTAKQPLGVTAIASIIDHNTSGIISAKSKGIDSFKKMEGHSYATWDSPLEKQVIKAVMEKQGGDINKVKFIPTTVTDVMSALTSNIDTVWVYEGWDVAAAKVKGFNYNFIKFSDVIPQLDFYTPVLVGGDKFMKENPETVKKFMAATAKGYEYAIKNPKEAADILCKAVPELDSKLILESQNYLAHEYKAEKPKWGTIDEKRWSAFYDWAYEKGVIEKPLGSKGFTNEYLPK